MPIYEYHCDKCGQFEATQKIKDRPLRRCPKCKGKVKKLISHTSFQLKGTGWYVTDYARKDGAGDGKQSKASAESKSKSATDGAEKTPGEKTPAKTTASESPQP